MRVLVKAASLFPGLCFRPEEMTLVLGSHGPTLNVYIAKPTVRPCLPVRHTAVAPSGGVACRHSHAPIGTRKDHTFATRRRHFFTVVTQYRCVGPVTYKSEQLDPSTSLFSFVPEMETVWLCWCVHIAHVSIYCPVDIVFEFGAFLDFIYFQQERGEAS